MIRLGLRGRLLASVIAAVAVALVGLILGFNLILGRTLGHDASDLARVRATAELGALRISDGQVTIGDQPDDRAADAFLWVFAGARLLEQPRAAPSITDAAVRLARGPGGFYDLGPTDTRLYARPVFAGGQRVGTVVAGVSLAPYEQTAKIALLASVILGAVVLLVVALTARWLLGQSLRPVVRMTRQAAAWSEHDLDRRFALGEPHDDLTELAATLDALLDRLAASLGHERRFSAEVSHELRTPLARILAESELALRRTREPDEYRHTLELVHRSADQLARTVETLVAAARYESGDTRRTADAAEAAAAAVTGCEHLARGRGLALQLDRPELPLRVGVDVDLAERILQPVLENACRYGVTRVRVSIAPQGPAVMFTIEDDGPGVADAELERIFDPGVRGTAAEATDDTGSGLGLSLARRLARAVHGDVLAVASQAGGRFVVRLPAG